MRIARRHVVTVGKRSLAVIIPKSWALRLKISQGDEVLLELSKDGSIKVRFPPRGEPSEETEEISIEIPEDLSERFMAKEVLTAYAIGYRRVFLRGSRSSGIPSSFVSLLKSLRGGDEEDIISRGSLNSRRVLEALLRFVEECVKEFSEFLKDPVEERGKKIHVIEEKTDASYYMFYRSVFKELSQISTVEILTESAVDYVAGIIVVKAAEDLVDAIDRIVWRIQEVGAFSEDLFKIFSKIRDTLEDAISCLAYSCEEKSLDEIFREILRIRALIKENMIRSPQPIQPMFAELEAVMNSVEVFVEVALLRRLRQNLTRQRRSSETKAS
jgi:phosphate uptake regulator